MHFIEKDQSTAPRVRISLRSFDVATPQHSLECKRKRKPSGRKEERRRGKLPNQIRHEINAGMQIGGWKRNRKPPK